MSSRLLATNDWLSFFLRLNTIPLCMRDTFFSNPSAYCRLFKAFLAVVNSASINMEPCLFSTLISVTLFIYPVVGLLMFKMEMADGY